MASSSVRWLSRAAKASDALTLGLPARAAGANARDTNKREATAETAAGIPQVFIEDYLGN